MTDTVGTLYINIVFPGFNTFDSLHNGLTNHPAHYYCLLWYQWNMILRLDGLRLNIPWKASSWFVLPACMGQACTHRAGMTEQACTHRAGMTEQACTHRAGMTEQACTHRAGMTEQACTHRAGMTEQACTHRAGMTEQAHMHRAGMHAQSRHACTGQACMHRAGMHAQSRHTCNHTHGLQNSTDALDNRTRNVICMWIGLVTEDGRCCALIQNESNRRICL